MWSTAVTVAVPPIGVSVSVSVLQAMVWTLIPLAVAMVSSNFRRVWASRPEHLPEEERGLKTVRHTHVLGCMCICKCFSAKRQRCTSDL